MRTYQFLILLCFLSSFFCENGGIKVTITQRLIDSLMDYFYNKYANKYKRNKIPDDGIAHDMEWGFENLSRNKISLKFDNGFIHVKVEDIHPYFRGKAKILGTKRFSAELQNFKFEVYIKVSSKKVSFGRYLPKVEVEGTPGIRFRLKTDVSGGIIGGILKGLVSFGKQFLPTITKTFLNSLKMLVNKIGDELPTQVAIDSSKGLYLDFTLASPPQIKSGALELNSIALLFNEKINSTKDSNRYPLTYLPSFWFYRNQLQLYVSEYFFNSAIYTLIKTHEKPIVVNSKTTMIGQMLPGLIEVYGDKNAKLTISKLDNSNVKLTHDCINVNAIGLFTINVEGINEPVYECEIEVSIKAKLSILSGPKLSSEILDMSSNVKSIITNKNPKVKSPLVGSALALVNTLFTPILKELTRKDFELKFPTVLGIEFKDVTLDVREHMLVINYNINQRFP